MCPCGCGCGSSSEDEAKENVKEVLVMIPCKYCGGLFPQTVATCPNCGAKRIA